MAGEEVAHSSVTTGNRQVADSRPIRRRPNVGAVGVQGELRKPTNGPVGVEPPTNGRPDGDETAVFLRRYADGNAVGVVDFFINKVLLISVFTFIYFCI